MFIVKTIVLFYICRQTVCAVFFIPAGLYDFLYNPSNCSIEIYSALIYPAIISSIVPSAVSFSSAALMLSRSSVLSFAIAIA